LALEEGEGSASRPSSLQSKRTLFGDPICLWPHISDWILSDFYDIQYTFTARQHAHFACRLLSL